MRKTAEMKKKITVFRTSMDEVFLKTLIQKQDGSSETIKSGKYKITENEPGKFVFVKTDCIPMRAFFVTVRDNRIYAREMADYISKFLVKASVPFVTEQIEHLSELTLFYDYQGEKC